MKKFFAFVIMVTMVMGVMVMGPEKAFATETISETTSVEHSDDVNLVVQLFKEAEAYVNANPNYDNVKVVKMMAGYDGDTVVLSTAWIVNDEVRYETYRYSHEELAEIKVNMALLSAKGALGIWES